MSGSTTIEKWVAATREITQMEQRNVPGKGNINVQGRQKKRTWLSSLPGSGGKRGKGKIQRAREKGNELRWHPQVGRRSMAPKKMGGGKSKKRKANKSPGVSLGDKEHIWGEGGGTRSGTSTHKGA